MGSDHGHEQNQNLTQRSSASETLPKTKIPAKMFSQIPGKRTRMPIQSLLLLSHIEKKTEQTKVVTILICI